MISAHDTPSVLAKPHKVILEPFPHIVIEDCLPEDYYRRLESSFPDWKDIAAGVSDENKRVDWNARHALEKDISPWWKAFISYHTSRAFYLDVLRDFETHIHLMYPQTAWVGMRNIISGMRFRDRGNFVLDCQIGVNTPTEKKTRVRGPHVDNPVELWGGLLYFPLDQGGDLILYKHNFPPKFIGKAELDDRCVTEVGRVPYKANTFVLFLNGVNSVHGVSERQSNLPRRLVNFVGEFRNPLFELPR